MSKFKKGNRIKCIKGYESDIILNKIGTVLCDPISEYIKVGFDEFINGHTCGGLCDYGYGWNMPKDYVILWNKNKRIQ
jgi:hypothetical protein